MFTSNQIEEIRKKLQLEGVKDSALPEAHPLTGKESIAVVQSGQNRKVGLDAFITSINNWCKADFLNLSKEGHSYTVEEAIAKTSPAKLGQVITFSNKKTGSWSVYQYTGETLEGWNDIDNWANILDTADYHFRGYFFNEELLKKNYPRPQVGDFAFIGTTLEEAVTFTCISAGNWYNTNYPALTFADKFKAVYSEDFGVFDAELEETLADRANKDAVGNVIHTYYASNKSLQETVSKEAVRAKEAEETNAKAISDETKARVSADTTLQGNIDKEATRAKQVEQANADAIKAVKETADSNTNDISALKETVEAGGSYPYYAFMRVKGSASPKFTKFFGSKDGLYAVLNHFHLGVIKDGKLNKAAAGARLTLSDTGEEIKIDGTDGDVCIYVDTPIYMLRATVTIDDVKYNALGLGLSPFVIGDRQAKKIDPFFFSADYTVNAKLEGDTLTKAYCIYNENVAGSYTAKNDSNTFFEQDLKPNGNGYPSVSVSALQNGEYARNKNTDVNSNSPYMGLWYDWYEILMIAMYGEIGTLDFCTESLFGYGCTSQWFSGTNNTSTVSRSEFPTKISSIRFADKDGANVFWGNLMSQSLQIGETGTKKYNVEGITATNYYSFLPELIHNRIIDNVIKNNLTDYVDDNDAVFTDLGAAVITDGSINVNDGTGMTEGQYYIKIMNVPNCKGIKDGVQTAVIDLYVKLTIKDNVYYSYKVTDLSGGTAIFKFSLPVYRGVCWFKGVAAQVEGFYYRQVNDDGTPKMEYWSADDIQNAPVIKLNTKFYDDDALTGALKGMTKKFETTVGDFWSKDMDYDMNIHNYEASGAGQHSYECGRSTHSTSWGASYSEANGILKQGHSCVNASMFGCSAFSPLASRMLSASYAFGLSYDDYAGALAGSLQQ